MKTKSKSIIRTVCHSFGGVVCAAAVMLIASSTQAQNLFEADGGSSSIYEFTPSGTQSTFATGLSYPTGLAFNNAGDLFVANYGYYGGNSITEITPNGSQSIFASGLNGPTALAFQGETLPVPEPSALGLLAIGMFGITLLRRHQR